MSYGQLNPDGLISCQGLWHLNDLNDSSGNGYTATNHGGTAYNTGKFGVCYFFDLDWFSLGKQTALNITGELTFLAWINPSGIAESGFGRYIYGGGYNGNVYNFAIAYSRSLANAGPGGGKFHVIWNNTQVAKGATALTLNAWNHIGFIRSGSTGTWTATFILNGSTDTITTGISVNPVSETDANADYTIGRCGNYNGLYTWGYLNDVAIYNRAMTILEVKQLYAQMKGAYGVVML